MRRCFVSMRELFPRGWFSGTPKSGHKARHRKRQGQDRADADKHEAERQTQQQQQGAEYRRHDRSAPNRAGQAGRARRCIDPEQEDGAEQGEEFEQKIGHDYG